MDVKIGSITPDTLLKVLSPEGVPLHGGAGCWNLPSGKRPGKWMPWVTPVECCKSGYHLIIPIGVKPIVVHDKVFHPDCFTLLLREARSNRGIPNLGRG